MKLKDCVTLESVNKSCIVLKVKPDQKFNLICLGCFDGDEMLFRLTRGKDVTCTIWRENGKSVSWHWGYNGYTLVSDNLDQAGRLIQRCIEQDFGYQCLY